MAERSSRTYKGIRSKYLVRPKKYIAVFSKVLYTGVAFLVLGTVVAFVMSGFQFTVLLGIAVPVSIAYGYSKMDFAGNHYEFCLLDVEFGEAEVVLQYYPEEAEAELPVHVPYQNITELEYVEELSCIRIGQAEVVNGKQRTVSILVFLEKGLLEKIYGELQDRVKKYE